MSNVLCVSIVDNGQQLQSIAEALRKYTDHDAIHLNLKQSYLDYDVDVKLPEINDYVKAVEIIDRIADCDFFIFSEIFPRDVKNVLDRLHVYHQITPSNSIIRVGGTYVRARAAEYHMSWVSDDWVFAGLGHDWSLISKVGRLLSLPAICPVEKIPAPVDAETSIRIAFSPTRREKGMGEFNRVIKSIMNEYDDVKGVPIIAKSWKESMLLKSRCQITFDQFMIPTYGNSAIEGMYLKHVVLSKIDDYTTFCYPDLPIISVKNEKELYNELKNVLDNRKQIKEIGNCGREFVLKHHTPEHVANRIDSLIKHVANKK